MTYTVSLNSIMPPINGNPEESEVEFTVRDTCSLHYETFLYPRACEVLKAAGMGHLVSQLSERSQDIASQATRIYDLRERILHPSEGTNVEDMKRELYSTIAARSPWESHTFSVPSPKRADSFPLYALLCHTRALESSHPYAPPSWDRFLQQSAFSLARGELPFSSDEFLLTHADLNSLYEECTKGSFQDMARAFSQEMGSIVQKHDELQRTVDSLRAFLSASQRPTEQETLAAFEEAAQAVLQTRTPSPLYTILYEIDEAIRAHPPSFHARLLQEGLRLRLDTSSTTLSHYDMLQRLFQASRHEQRIDPIVCFQQSLATIHDPTFSAFCRTLYSDLFLKTGRAPLPMVQTLAFLKEQISRAASSPVQIAALSQRELEARGIQPPSICLCGTCDHFFELRIGQEAPRYIQYSKGLNPFHS